MPLPAVFSGVLPLHSHSPLKWQVGKWHFSMWRRATRAALHTDLCARSGGFSRTQEAKWRGDVTLQARDEKAQPSETQQTEQWQEQQCFKGLSTTPWASRSRAGWQGKIATFSCCFFAGNSCFPVQPKLLVSSLSGSTSWSLPPESNSITEQEGHALKMNLSHSVRWSGVLQQTAIVTQNTVGFYSGYPHRWTNPIPRPKQVPAPNNPQPKWPFHTLRHISDN